MLALVSITLRIAYICMICRPFAVGRVLARSQVFCLGGDKKWKEEKRERKIKYLVLALC